MSYQVYTTDAIVCGNRTSNTSDKSYLILTENNGMVWVNGRSIREERSKQRFAMQDFSLVRVSLVKGKSGWRLGSVECLMNSYYAAKDRAERHCIVRCLAVVRRLVHGESSVPEVFADLRKLFELINSGNSVFESTSDYFTYRTLLALGYIEARESYDSWLSLEETLPKESALAMKKGLVESHL